MAVLVSNYRGVPLGAVVKVTTSAKPSTTVWDLHTGKKLGVVARDGSFTLTLNAIAAHMVYVGTKYGQAVSK
jgi:hypothetical protein